MKRNAWIASLLLAALVLSLTACAQEKPATEVAAESFVDDPIETETAEDLVLLVYGGWNEEAEDREYSLSGESAAMIAELFYAHEKEICSTPCDCIDVLEFRMGEDYLYASSTESIEELHGRIGGELVQIKLSAQESEAVQQLIAQTNIPEQ